jgi:hypothetical protein
VFQHKTLILGRITDDDLCRQLFRDPARMEQVALVGDRVPDMSSSYRSFSAGPGADIAILTKAAHIVPGMDL